MKNMVKEAKKMHADKIAVKLGYSRGSSGYREKAKDLMKLNYVTLVELSPKVKK